MLVPSAPAKEVNPHVPSKLTYVLEDGESYKTLYQTICVGPLNTWWPDLYFCFCDLNHVYRATGQAEARRYGFYVCPGHTRNRKQWGGLESSFCKSWDCVTSNDGEWRWTVSRPDLATFKYVRPILYDPPLSQPYKPYRTGDLDQIRLLSLIREDGTHDGHQAYTGVEYTTDMRGMPHPPLQFSLR